MESQLFPPHFRDVNDDELSEYGDVEIDIANSDVEFFEQHISENATGILDHILDENLRRDVPRTDGRSFVNLRDIRIDTDTVPACLRCATKIHIQSGHYFERGMHISFGRYLPIHRWNSTLNEVFQSISSKTGLQQRFLYHHHAIVTEVHQTSDHTARLTLVEFTSVGDITFEVVEQMRDIDLQAEYTNHIKYLNNRYNADEIVARARSRVGRDGYDLLNNNCEHTAVWCASGEDESFQASDGTDNLIRQDFSWIGTLIGKIVQIVRAAMGKLGCVGNHCVKFCRFVLGSVVLAAVFFLIELVVTVLRFIKLKHQFKNGLICKKCYEEKKVFLISKIMISAAASIALLVIHPASKVVFILVGIAAGIGSIFVLPHIFTFLHGKIRSSINPLYTIPKTMVRRYQHIKPGDVLTIPNDHDVIVKGIRNIPRRSPSRHVHLDIVHFAYRGVFGTRMVTRDRFSIKLDSDWLQVYDYPDSVSLDSAEVVENAIQKVGNRDFHMIYNRSSHMCLKCKIHANFQSNIPLPNKRNVIDESQVSAGDMVNFSYYTLPHKGIVVEKHPPGDIVEIEYYHVENGEVVIGAKIFDLDAVDILIHNFGNHDPMSSDEILIRAREQLGDKVYSFRPYKSARYVRDCVIPNE